MFRKISLDEIRFQEHRGVLEDLISRLKEDLGRPVELGVTCIAKSTSGVASNPEESWVVAPKYVIRDSERAFVPITFPDITGYREDKYVGLRIPMKPKIFVAGDGDIGGNPLSRVLKLLGLIKELPWGYGHFGYIDLINESYFPEGSRARDLPSLRDYFLRRSEDLRKMQEA